MYIYIYGGLYFVCQRGVLYGTSYVSHFLLVLAEIAPKVPPTYSISCQCKKMHISQCLSKSVDYPTWRDEHSSLGAERVFFYAKTHGSQPQHPSCVISIGMVSTSNERSKLVHCCVRDIGTCMWIRSRRTLRSGDLQVFPHRQ